MAAPLAGSSTPFSTFFGLLDDDSNRRGLQFELAVKYFLLADPVLSARVSDVFLWREWRVEQPGQWHEDTGIDLVARMTNGDLWAIQAKALDPQYSVTKASIDSFLSASNRPEFAHRLLIATTNRIGRHALATIDAQEKSCGVLLLEDLEDANISWPSDPCQQHVEPLQRLTPRPHQRDAVAAVAATFAKHDRCQLLMACGTGKTFTSQIVAEQLDARTVLVLVPTLILLKQTLRSFATNRSADFDWIAVCSDDTVGGDDSLTLTTSGLGVPVTTEISEIEAFLLASTTNVKVVFATYQSSPKIEAAMWGQTRIPAFDLVIADEAHRCAGLVSEAFGAVLAASRIRAAKRLFMTASRRTFTRRAQAAAARADHVVACMSDEETFGPVAYQLTFADAIGAGLLTDYQVAVIGIDEDTVARSVDRRELVSLHGFQTDAETLARIVGTLKALDDYDLRRVVSFHGRVDSAVECAAAFPTVLAATFDGANRDQTLWAAPVTGAMPAGDRSSRLARLRDTAPHERSLLTNARVLNEGVDLPSLDGVVFFDPKRSEVDIVQAVGRAMRLSPGKVVGTIVIPVFLRTDDDAETVLDESSFKQIADVVFALRSLDASLGEELDEVRRNLGRRRKAGALPDRIRLDFPLDVSERFVESITTRIVERTTSSFEEMAEMYAVHLERHGPSALADGFDGENAARLRAWISGLRQSYKKGNLRPDRIARMEGFPGWEWDPRAARYEIGFAHLEAYVAEFGTADVPQFHRTLCDFPLGAWVQERRKERFEPRCTPERARRLEALPGWTWHAKAEGFERGLAEWKEFAAGRIDFTVRTTHITPSGFNLGVFVQGRREEFKRGTLSAERVRRLEACEGWAWSAVEVRRNRLIAEVSRFAESTGSAKVPPDYTTEEGFPLAARLGRQRRDFVAGRLEPSFARRLADATGWALPSQYKELAEAV